MALEAVAEVAVDVKHPSAKKEYFYTIPDELVPAVGAGDLVLVPFNNTKVNGVVMRVFGPGEYSGEYRLKNLIKKEQVSLPPEMVDLSRSLARYYGAAPIDFLKLMLPPAIGVKQEAVYRAVVEKCVLSDRAVNQKKIFDLLAAFGPLTAREICGKIDLPLSSIQGALSGLVKKGMVIREYRVIRRKPETVPDASLSRPLNLTAEQAAAVDQICRNMAGEKKTVLLYGVTGSGKTEVYIRAIEKALYAGKKALLLVPEISLTPQMLTVFQARFPQKVAVIHSRLSQGERFDEWHRIYSREADIVIGARSAVFAPVRDLGLIIIDEEHESSYKQMEHPFYDARVVARIRAEREGAMLIMGSATPSVESYFKALKGDYLLVKLTKRVSGRPLPSLEIIDMKEELKSGNRHIFSRKLFAGMKEAIVRGCQVILFLNRRGHSTFVICRDCGFVLKCPHCDISLTYHFEDRSGRCHYCGFQIKAPDVCPVCGGGNIRYFGAGTEKVEQEVNRLFPGIKTIRIDADSTSRKGSLEQMLSCFKRGEAQILIGTQAVAKGLDFPKVALVGIISADTSLNMPDFRAGERTFQLITQVAGRAGRGQFPGRVYVQTYCPESFAINAACKNNFAGFYMKELENRRQHNYPPFCHLLNIIFAGPREEVIKAEAFNMKQFFMSKGFDGVEIYGPAPAPRLRIKDNYRYHILLKSREEETLIQVEDFLKSLKKNSKINVAWDMDPQDLL
jgi:primosomal protein N' (replication factor Y)